VEVEETIGDCAYGDGATRQAFAEYRKRRQVSEHRLARLVQLGIRQSRYFGRVKTLFQLLMAAAVANLTLVATKLRMMGKADQPGASVLALFIRVS